MMSWSRQFAARRMQYDEEGTAFQRNKQQINGHDLTNLQANVSQSHIQYNGYETAVARSLRERIYS